MDFAKSVLEKHGWSEGKGLGRNEHGRSEALRPKLKFDTKGIGETGSNNFQWWDHAFNAAAVNIQVGSDSEDEGGAIKLKSKGEVRKGLISTRPPKKSQKTMFYGGFVKAASLNSTDGPDPVDMSKKMGDDEVFAACGGLTGHKAARHGLQLGGKLARVEAADRALAARLSSGVDIQVAMVETTMSPTRKRSASLSDSDDGAGPAEIAAPVEAKRRKKEKKSTKGKKSRSVISDRDGDEEGEMGMALDKKIKKKKRKDKKKQKSGDTAMLSDGADAVSPVKQSGKSERPKKSKESSKGESVSSNEKKKKKKKKKKEKSS